MQPRADVSDLPLFASQKKDENGALGVREFLDRIKAPIKSAFPNPFTVSGDIESIRPWRESSSQAHYYVRLIEKTAGYTFILQVHVPPEVFQQSGIKELRTSSKLLVVGKVNLNKNEISLEAEEISDIGISKLFQQIEKWKEQYKDIFLRQKRPLPFLPKRIAVISNQETQGFSDFRKHLRYGKAVIRATKMQGEAVAENIAAAIQEINREGFDLIVIVRGGGASLVDLFPYNRPEIITAIANSQIPVAVAVGHESDVSLADMAADLSYGTPTAAAKAISETFEAFARRADDLMGKTKAEYEKKLALYERFVTALREQTLTVCEHALAREGERLQAVMKVTESRFLSCLDRWWQRVRHVMEQTEMEHTNACTEAAMRKRHRTITIIAAVIIAILIAAIGVLVFKH